MALIRPEDELLKLLDALAFCVEPMFAINERNRIVFWNKPLQRLLGWTYDDVAGKSCGTVLAGNDQFGNRYCCEACPIVAIAQRGDSIRQFGLTYRTKEDDYVPVDVSVLKFTLPATKSVVLAHTVQLARQVQAIEPPQPAYGTNHADARVRELTTREIEVLGMLAAGQNATDVANHLGISPLTARNHIQHIFEKLEVHSKAEAVAFAYKMRVVS
jgi:DNA-binding CsgD family transcriptional regulator